MKETALQYVREYAPIVLFMIVMFIDRFGFGTSFSAFRNDIKKSFDLARLKKEIQDVRDDLRSVTDELREIKQEIKKEREAITRIRGSKK